MSQKFFDLINAPATLSPVSIAIYTVAALIGYIIGVYVVGVIFPK